MRIQSEPRPPGSGLVGVQATSLSCEHLFQVIDVVYDGIRAFALEEEYQVQIARVGRGGYTDEWHAGGFGAAGVIDCVADIVNLAIAVVLQDAEEAVGRGLVILNIVHPKNWVEGHSGGEPVQRHLGFGLGSSGEDGEAEVAVELFESAGPRDPLFAHH